MTIDKNLDRFDFTNGMDPAGFEYHPRMGASDQAIMRSQVQRRMRILPPITLKKITKTEMCGF
jgi:hypothetical protein